MTTVWHSGQPPEIGWWPASIRENKKCLRWWNGVCWSISAHQNANIKLAALNANIPSQYQKEIEWTERWWV